MSEIHDDYVEGDVNTVDVEPGERAASATALLRYLATSLADEPDEVDVEVEQRAGKVVLSLRVAQADMGRVIGRRGRTAQALRTLVGAAGARDGVTTSVDILD